MTDWDAEEEEPRRFRIGILVTAGLLFVAGIMTIGYLTTGSPFFLSQRWTPEQVDRALQDSEAAELYRAIKASYPEEYRAFLGNAAAGATEHGGDQLERYAALFGQRMLASHSAGLARAHNPHLIDIARQQVQLLTLLRRADARLCAIFTSGGEVRDSQLPAEARALLTRIEAMTIRAARIGERSSRGFRPALTNEERRALLAAASRRSPEAARVIADPRPMQAAPPDQQCAAGIAMYEAAIGLPPETAATAIVMMMGPVGGGA